MFSDLACPWCYIGQRRLDKALEQMPGVKAEVEWHAFLLDWNAPLAGAPQGRTARDAAACQPLFLSAVLAQRAEAGQRAGRAGPAQVPEVAARRAGEVRVTVTCLHASLPDTANPSAAVTVRPRRPTHQRGPAEEVWPASAAADAAGCGRRARRRRAVCRLAVARQHSQGWARGC